MLKIVVFGDEWGLGEELEDSELSFPEHIGRELNLKVVNLCEEGPSIGKTLFNITKYQDEIDPGDIVLVTVPLEPKDLNSGAGCKYCINKYQDSYKTLIQQRTGAWFRYHHMLFLYTIQCLLESKRCKAVISTSYGPKLNFDEFKFPFDKTKFLSETSLGEILTTADLSDAWVNYKEDNQETDAIPEFFTGKYFEGKNTHPNDLGHREIARLILEKLGE